MPEPSGELIAAIVLVLGAAATYLKSKAEINKIRAERLATKAERDLDSEKLHDRMLKAEFSITQLKDNQALQATVVDDLRDQCATLNTNIVKLDTNVANLTEAIKDLKHK